MAVFLDLTSTTFVKSGAVATASGLYIILAVAFGLLVYRSGMPFWLGTIIFVPLVFAGAWLGEVLPAGTLNGRSDEEKARARADELGLPYEPLDATPTDPDLWGEVPLELLVRYSCVPVGRW